MVDIIVTGHGRFSEGLLSALQLIVGEQRNVQNVNFLETDSVENLSFHLEKALEKTGKEVIFLTDLLGGSPFKESVMLKKQYPDKNIEVISGTNFPLLLSAVMQSSEDALELAQTIVTEGQAAMVRYRPASKRQRGFKKISSRNSKRIRKRRRNLMKIQKFENILDLTDEVVALVEKIVENRADSVLCFACGETPRPVMNRLVEMKKSGEIDFSRVRIIGLDEWIGVGRDTVGSCQQMLYDDFFIPLNLREDQIMLFDGLTEDLDKEIEKMNHVIEDLGIDFILLGIGMNGHIGLNEPGCEVDVKAHLIDLSEMTQTVMKKYFAEQAETSLTQGLSLGFQQILSAEHIVLMATGERKAEIVEKVVQHEPTNEIPATLLKNSTKETLFFVDAEAGRLIT
ncbi:MAG: 6-phosphogluconolactonase [Streptococcaceae bacterium]|jgi:glucosamine-6-phosphate isomerase|nr:6-phosphogluconolactonase [Streptococcaceae bacterium]